MVLLLDSVKPDWSRRFEPLRHERSYQLAGSVLTQPLDKEAAARAADFLLTRDRVEFEGKCMAILPLPDYPVSGIRTGQTKAGRVLWEARIPAR